MLSIIIKKIIYVRGPKWEKEEKRRTSLYYFIKNEGKTQKLRFFPAQGLKLLPSFMFSPAAKILPNKVEGDGKLTAQHTKHSQTRV